MIKQSLFRYAITLLVSAYASSAMGNFVVRRIGCDAEGRFFGNGIVTLHYKGEKLIQSWEFGGCRTRESAEQVAEFLTLYTEAMLYKKLDAPQQDCESYVHSLQKAIKCGESFEPDEAIDQICASIKSHLAAMYIYLGDVYTKEKSQFRDLKAAQSCFEQAAAQEFNKECQTVALYRLGLINYVYDEINDFQKSRNYFEKIIERSGECPHWASSWALFWIATMYRNGDGVPQDYKLALEYYQKAAGDYGCLASVYAARNLVTIYLEGRTSVPKNFAKARYYAENALRVAQETKLKNANDALAQLNIKLAYIYFHGLGVPQDKAKARQYVDQARRLPEFTRDVWVKLTLKEQGLVSRCIREN